MAHKQPVSASMEREIMRYARERSGRDPNTGELPQVPSGELATLRAEVVRLQGAVRRISALTTPEKHPYTALCEIDLIAREALQSTPDTGMVMVSTELLDHCLSAVAFRIEKLSEVGETELAEEYLKTRGQLRAMLKAADGEG